MDQSENIETLDLNLVIDEVKLISPETDLASVSFLTAVVLVSATQIGTDIGDLVEFTGYPAEFIASISRRMHKAGLWDESGYVGSEHWFLPEGYLVVPFILDSFVAEGMCEAEPIGNGDYRYRRARVN